MIIPLPQTNTRTIVKELTSAQEHYTHATGRVLTLIVVASASDDIDNILDSVRTASHEHPSRVLVVIANPDNPQTSIDAELRVGGEAGSSEIVVMQLHGALAGQAEAVVTPLLLPDTPIVAWWPTRAPHNPAQDPIGRIAQRRITNVLHEASSGREALQSVASGYSPGDSDMAWAAITLWRGIVASALDRYPQEPVISATIAGPAAAPAVDIAAGWLADRLGVEVNREYREATAGRQGFPIEGLHFERDSSNVTIKVVDNDTVKVSVPGSPASLVALNVRTQAEMLSEELRHLDTDHAYAHALRALGRVTYGES
ncbi:glucose-6-phosphate dehydrogenase assembly protein OpcA [Corynebacterium endometrii]|uniref:Glucose-6-phosphate dehydrogenase subunit n=1 Tax=Corynebacterium endometrii TaxID=2488819 RepID=A0A4P7QHZ6_9CORY|nr:glucose-6-phosphate dehydrogenase assembly protein OpcA [Corynebacterium endometrii]QCB28484.1 Glucose-6-phosphate dehydrogenase subunit [Corynebacterium endometrii]